MASFGHVAVGLLAGRLHGGAGDRLERRSTLGTLALFATLATLPDVDVLLVAFGTSDTGPFGHRGALHSLTMALVVGIACALAAWRWRWPVLRTALAGAAAVASHTVLDLLGAGGRSLVLFWPLSSARYHSPWRLLPDAPRGLKLLSRPGLLELGTEFAIFLPMTLYALWPHIATRLGRTSRLGGTAPLDRAPLPNLQIVDRAAVVPNPLETSPNSVERDPSVRSNA
jgi:inner membrane protein